jgi:hypothetical protein
VMHKRHPLDCGRSQCGVCHFEKVYPKGHVKAKTKAQTGFMDELFGDCE